MVLELLTCTVHAAVLTAEQEAQADGLRQQVNEAFKAGQYQQAIDCYWQAVSHNPQDYALYNNISLAALKLGDIEQVGLQMERGLLAVLFALSYWSFIAHSDTHARTHTRLALTHSLTHTLLAHLLHAAGVLQALQAAVESIRVLPTVSKSWVRLGDAYKAVQRWAGRAGGMRWGWVGLGWVGLSP
jgi:tetratricopeptide (TPR) repeat protein